MQCDSVKCGIGYRISPQATEPEQTESDICNGKWQMYRLYFTIFRILVGNVIFWEKSCNDYNKVIIYYVSLQKRLVTFAIFSLLI